MKRKFIIVTLFWAVCAIGQVFACTSAIVSARATRDGKALLWKHRDTGTEHNFVERVASKGTAMAYIALFNGGDSLLAEAWTGLNEAGFGIMNTASYNLAPDTTAYKDREGIVMKRALECCRSMADFEQLLDTLQRPLGVQANFGVIDASGEGAYYETCDTGYVKYSTVDADGGVIVRTNFSVSGNDSDGYGYIRYNNALHLLEPHIVAHDITPMVFTEELSRSFYHSLLKRNMALGDERWVVDQDFIPRYSSTASIVIEGGERPVMWTALGYPPCSHVVGAWVDEVPEELRPLAEGWRSEACNESLRLKHEKAFPISRGSGSHYIDMQALVPIMAQQQIMSLQEYARHRATTARGVAK